MKKGNFICSGYDTPPISRREMLKKSSAGFGSLALAGLLGEEAKGYSSDKENFGIKTNNVIHKKTKNIIF